MVSFMDTDHGTPFSISEICGCRFVELEKFGKRGGGFTVCVFSDLATGATDLLVGPVFSSSFFGQHVCGMFFLFYGAKKCTYRYPETFTKMTRIFTQFYIYVSCRQGTIIRELGRCGELAM